MNGIFSGSDFAGAIVTAIGFMGAIVAFILNQRIERKQKVDDERRRAVANLIAAVEGTMTKLSLSSRVGLVCLPEMDEEKITEQKALSIVRAYGCNSLVESAVCYQKATNTYRWALVWEKEERQVRLSEIPEGEKFTRGEKYAVKLEKTALRRDEMMCARDKFLEEVSCVLNTKVSRLEAFIGVEASEQI